MEIGNARGFSNNGKALLRRLKMVDEVSAKKGSLFCLRKETSDSDLFFSHRFLGRNSFLLEIAENARKKKRAGRKPAKEILHNSPSPCASSSFLSFQRACIRVDSSGITDSISNASFGYVIHFEEKTSTASSSSKALVQSPIEEPERELGISRVAFRSSIGGSRIAWVEEVSFCSFCEDGTPKDHSFSFVFGSYIIRLNADEWFFWVS